jgi:hypothetical protein
MRITIDFVTTSGRFWFLGGTDHGELYWQRWPRIVRVRDSIKIPQFSGGGIGASGGLDVWGYDGNEARWYADGNGVSLVLHVPMGHLSHDEALGFMGDLDRAAQQNNGRVLEARPESAAEGNYNFWL